MTWVRVKLALEEVPTGETLEVRLKGDEPVRNVPKNAVADGHAVEAQEALADGTVRLVIRARHDE